MEMRKQGGEGQGTARSATKSAGKKQSGEQGSSANQSTSANQGTGQGTGATQSPSSGQGTTGNQGTTGTQHTTGSQGMAGTQGKSGQQGTSGQQRGEEDLLQHAKHAGGEIMNQVQQRAGTQVNRQKEAAASSLSQVADAVRRIRENLGGEEGGAIARYAADYSDKAADGLERLSTYIREQDPKRLLDDVQNFGRRRPALLVGGAFLLGFAGARLIKSSMDTASQHQSYGTNVQSAKYTRTNVPAARLSTGRDTV